MPMVGACVCVCVLGRDEKVFCGVRGKIVTMTTAETLLFIDGDTPDTTVTRARPFHAAAARNRTQ
jgi:hypothetical protein